MPRQLSDRTRRVPTGDVPTPSGRVIAAAVAFLVMVFALASCSGDSDAGDAGGTDDETEETVETVEPTTPSGPLTPEERATTTGEQIDAARDDAELEPIDRDPALDEIAGQLATAAAASGSGDITHLDLESLLSPLPGSYSTIVRSYDDEGNDVTATAGDTPRLVFGWDQLVHSGQDGYGIAAVEETSREDRRQVEVVVLRADELTEDDLSTVEDARSTSAVAFHDANYDATATRDPELEELAASLGPINAMKNNAERSASNQQLFEANGSPGTWLGTYDFDVGTWEDVRVPGGFVQPSIEVTDVAFGYYCQFAEDAESPVGCRAVERATPPADLDTQVAAYNDRHRAVIEQGRSDRGLQVSDGSATLYDAACEIAQLQVDNWGDTPDAAFDPIFEGLPEGAWYTWRGQSVVGGLPSVDGLRAADRRGDLDGEGALGSILFQAAPTTFGVCSRFGPSGQSQTVFMATSGEVEPPLTGVPYPVATVD